MDVKETFAAQLSSLYRISDMLCTSFELDGVLDKILKEAVTITCADAGSILLLDDGFLRIRKALKLSPEVIANTRIAVGSGIAGKVVETGEAVLINGKAERVVYGEVVERDVPIASSMCAPMISGGRVLGVLTVRLDEQMLYNEDHLEFFKALANHAATAIRIASLYSVEHERLEMVRNERERMKAIFEHLPDVVVAFNADYVIYYANDVAVRVFGEDCDMVGDDVRMHFPAISWSHVNKELKSRGFVNLEAQPIHNRGDAVWHGLLKHWNDESLGDSCVMLLHNVTERLRVERMKTEFMSSVSHELKTPLTSIIGFLELLSEKELLPDRRKRCLDICRDEAQRLYRLIEDVLTVSKLESGNFSINMHSNMLDGLISQAVSSMAECYPSYQFTFSSYAENIVCEYDEVLIDRVISNLLSNAVKYTPGEHGRIDTKIERGELGVVVSVQDNGIGIPREKIPYIFEKFYRVDNSLTRQRGGVGLGLANARYIVEKHGGALWVESVEGKGSKFSFTLPNRASQSDKVCSCENTL